MNEENKKRALSKSIWNMMKKSGVFVSDEEKNKIINRLKVMKNCVYCKFKTYVKGEVGYTKENGRAIDHIIPLEEEANKQYTNIPENLVIACGSCNSSKHDSDVIEWAKRKGIGLPDFIIDYVKRQWVIING